MERWVGRVALVTGASVGLGRTISQALVEHGMIVYGCARECDKIKVNVLALSICTREAVKQMKERNIDDGHIMHMNSMHGHGFPTDAHFYIANKFMVTALTEGLRRELRAMGSSIRASCISPALVEDTDIFIRLLGGKGNSVRSPFKPLEPKDIADLVVYILAAPPHMEIHDIHVRGTEQPLWFSTEL
ncbi:dehydrogenase/reductase SDR family member 11-like [Ptychodera flava]|uniref:dehydrogenase/reductase SDR family member 11-like n=1 Tax=Ptychodera flava TaxID=63121 RepID=UPI00396A034D